MKKLLIAITVIMWLVIGQAAVWAEETQSGLPPELLETLREALKDAPPEKIAKDILELTFTMGEDPHENLHHYEEEFWRQAWANDPEKAWKCYDYIDAYQDNPILTLKRSDFKGNLNKLAMGEIELYGETTRAVAFTTGLKKVWEWYDYQIQLEPSGKAHYLDFTNSTDGSAKPEEIYKCREAMSK